MRTPAEKPAGKGQWQVNVMPLKPRARATAAYSSGMPKACLHNVVWQWDS